MDSWSEIQIKKMESGGNEQLNSFFAQYGIAKETDIVTKYNTNAASVYRDRIQALAEGKPWRDPPVVKEGTGFGKSKPPLSGGRNGSYGSNGSGGGGGGGGWDSWDTDDGFRSSSDMRRNQSTGDVRGAGGMGGGPVRSKSTEDIYTRAQLEASAANKESFFARKRAENESRPDGLPPSQGGKYVGFGSTPPPPSSQRNDAQGDVFSVVSQGFGKLSLAAAAAAQSAATVVQAGTKEISTKVKDGGYDHKVNETVTVVTAKTSEIGQKTWGIMKGVMAMASQKVEEYTKEGINWKTDNWQRNDIQVLGMIGTAKTIGRKNQQREQHLITVMVGPAGTMPKMMDMIISTRVPQIRKLLVTMGNQIQLGQGEDFSKMESFHNFTKFSVLPVYADGKLVVIGSYPMWIGDMLFQGKGNCPFKRGLLSVCEETLFVDLKVQKLLLICND
ncbi:hypothetical protein CMV_010621 [Castanea mollissima]|uniref:Uncharacterized protein n=1 Tax=Castanea mollissima TaxID=60419 RepID=A0A8J4R576_9ROSI|nr:hypothetical protein CMV_010621 [Castanea mollissima]